jgi:cell division inhibitor SulA
MMPPIVPAMDVKHDKLTKHEQKALKAAAKLAAAAHIKFDHDKKDKHDRFDLPALQVPDLALPNPSQPPMMPPADIKFDHKLTKHEKKAMKAAARLAAAATLKFDHHDKHGKFDHELPAVLVNPNPSAPPMSLPNPSQPPMMPPTMPAVDVKHDKHSKHDKIVDAKLAAAAQLAAAAGVNINQVAAAAGVNVADIVMRNEPRFEGLTTLG